MSVDEYLPFLNNKSLSRVPFLPVLSFAGPTEGENCDLNERQREVVCVLDWASFINT